MKVLTCIVLALAAAVASVGAMNFDREFNDVIEPEVAEVDEMEFVPKGLTKKQGRLGWWNWHFNFDHHDHHDDAGSCSCKGKICECCIEDYDFNIYIKEQKFHLSACVEFTHLHDQTYDLQVRVHQQPIITQKEINLNNPPRLCYNLPHFPSVEACLKFHDVINDSACVDIVSKIKHRFISTDIVRHLGCFTAPTERDSYESFDDFLIGNEE